MLVLHSTSLLGADEVLNCTTCIDCFQYFSNTITDQWWVKAKNTRTGHVLTDRSGWTQRERRALFVRPPMRALARSARPNTTLHCSKKKSCVCSHNVAAEWLLNPCILMTYTVTAYQWCVSLAPYKVQDPAVWKNHVILGTTLYPRGRKRNSKSRSREIELYHRFKCFLENNSLAKNTRWQHTNAAHNHKYIHWKATVGFMQIWSKLKQKKMKRRCKVYLQTVDCW